MKFRYQGDIQIMTLFQNFNFMASINNLTILVIVVVLSVYSRDCFSPFWQLFESSPPKFLKPGRNIGPQWKLHFLAVFEVSSAAEVFHVSKCVKIVWRDVLGIGWMGQPLHLEILQLLPSDFRTMRSRVRMLLGGTLASISSSCLQKRVESTVSRSPRIFQYTGPSEQQKKHSISFLPWVNRFTTG